MVSSVYYVCQRAILPFSVFASPVITIACFPVWITFTGTAKANHMFDGEGVKFSLYKAKNLTFQIYLSLFLSLTFLRGQHLSCSADLTMRNM